LPGRNQLETYFFPISFSKRPQKETKTKQKTKAQRWIVPSHESLFNVDQNQPWQKG